MAQKHLLLARSQKRSGNAECFDEFKAFAANLISPRPLRTIAFTVGLALLVFVATRLILPNERSRIGDPSISFFSFFLPQAWAESSAPEPSKLVVNQPASHQTGEATPLGVASNLADADILIISGLAKETNLSAGSRVSDQTWTLFGREVKDVVIQPSPQFVGTMDIAFELLPFGGNGTITERRDIRFEWVVASQVRKVEAAVEHSKDKPSTTANRQLSSQQVTSLLKRGNELISSGDLAAARLVLKPAAEAGDPRAAEVLAETYDPNVLQKLSVHGMTPDQAIAQYWYQKAKELGSGDALRRLSILANTPH
jgi:hypothetical protein